MRLCHEKKRKKKKKKEERKKKKERKPINPRKKWRLLVRLPR